MMPEAIRGLVGRIGGTRNALIIGTGVVAVVLIFVVSRLATRQEWVPLLPGMSLDAVAEVTTKLDEAKLPYRLVKAGSEVQIGADDLPRARVLLAREGLPARGRPGFELFDRPAWGMTDFTQRINYRRALEGELERTISGMRGIEAAQVHLALDESRSLRRDAKPHAASVVLTLRTGERPSAEMVEGVASLVSSAVDGLSSENVSVLDNAGRLLSAAAEPGMPSAALQKQLRLRREVEQYLELKAEEMIVDIVGAGNARVRIAADINFDRVDRTEQIVDPDQVVTTREERTDIVPSPGQEGAGSTAVSSTFEASRTVETVSGAVGTVKRLTVAVLLNERPDAQPLSPELLARVESLVSNAVGLNPARGDAISVVNAPFEPVVPAPVTVTKPDIITVVQPALRPVLTLIAILAVAFVALRTLKTLKPPVPELAAPAAASALPKAEDEAPEEVVPPPRQVPLVQPASGDPDMAARVIRAWMKEN